MSGSSAITSVASNLSESPVAFPSPNRASESSAPFSRLFSDAIGDVGALEDQAHTAVGGLMRGTGVDVHQAVIAMQKVDMAFELALSVRNKAMQAYQSVMGMQF
jgi:flagellar hook-basal body complex protein FliE